MGSAHGTVFVVGVLNVSCLVYARGVCISSIGKNGPPGASKADRLTSIALRWQSGLRTSVSRAILVRPSPIPSGRSGFVLSWMIGTGRAPTEAVACIGRGVTSSVLRVCTNAIVVCAEFFQMYFFLRTAIMVV